MSRNHQKHWESGGRLEWDALTGEMRSRFQYDHKWECRRCRPFKEGKESQRIIKAFNGKKVWLLVGGIEVANRLARRGRGQFVALPLWDHNFAIFTTRKECDNSELVTDIVRTLTLVMPHRWTGTLRSSRGLLPPARPVKSWEAYNKGMPGLRCWHLHEPRTEAGECAAVEMPKVYNLLEGWAVRPTSRFKAAGRVDLSDHEIELLLNRNRIVYRLWPLRIAAIRWDDPRWQSFLTEANWIPPSPTFQPPPSEVTVTIKNRRMTVAQ